MEPETYNNEPDYEPADVSLTICVLAAIGAFCLVMFFIFLVGYGINQLINLIS